MATPSPPAQRQGQQPGVQQKMEPQPSVTRKAYKPAEKLKGKIALITGGDSGIGRSVAHHFALEGAAVAFTYVSPREDKDAQETLRLLRDAQRPEHKQPLAIPVDLGHHDNCKEVVRKVAEHFGGNIDVLVNNAAEQHTHKTLEEISPEEWDRTFKTNMHSYFYLSKYALPHMKEGSCIINTTSVNAYKGNASLLPYSTTKSAIVGFTRSLALMVVDKGIRVNGVAPGPVWTPLIPASFEEEKVEGFGKQVPMKRVAQPDEIAPSYVFLACDDSSYFTGQVLHPNGGVVVNA
ncbi:unnamed protein product [Closterium sp. NIES-64]|nr:unnamed protein product [Closterium sp. NIES-64]CAI6010862.1 unnamed protein product [Closterium sp. NIES-65]